MTRDVTHRWLTFALLLLAAASLGLVACQASTETKQGGLGEFCNNRDSDCREEFVCENSECVFANPAATDGCQGICNKIESCGLTEINCHNDCYDQIDTWADGIIDLFAECVVDDLTCEELGSSAEEAAQTCYYRLPEADEERVERCRSLVSEVESCRPNRDTSDNYSTADFNSDCLVRARTTDAEVWQRTDECAEAIEFGGECSETMECINDVFKLEDDAKF